MSSVVNKMELGWAQLGDVPVPLDVVRGLVEILTVLSVVVQPQEQEDVFQIVIHVQIAMDRWTVLLVKNVE